MPKKYVIILIVIAAVWLAYQYDIDTYIVPPSARLPDGGQYYGEIKNGLFTGEGIIRWSNGSSYHGDFENGLFSGVGKLVEPNGSIYEGQFVEGQMNGQGQLKTADGDIYQGEIKDYYPDGFGRWQFDQGSSYVGHVIKGKYHGQGTLVIKDGDSYTGTFENGRYHGEGDLRYANGNSYNGQFNKNQLHGQGRYKTRDGDSYEGDFVDSQFTGEGVFADTEGNRYEGGFKDWLYDGSGNYIGVDGDQYEGEFVAGELTGEGVYKDGDGQIYRGQFVNWQFHGKGDLLQANGDHYQGNFKYGTFNGSGSLTYAAPLHGKAGLTGKWRYDKYIGDGKAPDPREANTEKALYNQNKLIQKTIAGVLPTEHDTINLYFVGIGGDGNQDVFFKEVTNIRDHFDQAYNTLGRSAVIINNPETVEIMPLATTTAIEQVLQGVSAKMHAEQDILFVYLTSHGSHNHEFVFAQDGLALANLPAKRLAEIVNALPVKWKVVVISACYSGGFIPELADNNSLIITAAAHDRKSFGCSDDADMTYFGRAFFLDALPQSTSFVTAFEKAKALVHEREKDIIADNKSNHSNPQISQPQAITDYLKKWRAQLDSLPQTEVAVSVYED